jgi:hypothetical protein
MTEGSRDAGPVLEAIDPGEAARIDNVAALTVQQLDRRYAAGTRCLRGVHPKDHGCVEAVFTVSDSLPRELQVGILARPGEQFAAAIRYSNASALVTPDSLEPGPDGKPVVAHGSRGMAVKLYGVRGERLMPGDGERTQDFLMINQPVFAFANVEDYEALSKVLVNFKDDPRPFFARLASPDPAVSARAKRTAQIVQQVKALTAPPSFQAPPLSPFDNRYFSAAPFLFGEGRAMKFSATPVNPMSGDVNAACQDPDYLRAALRKRMAEAQGKPICFDFQVQVRDAASLAGKVESDIEDVCTLWDEARFPFVTVARITIPSQDVAAPRRQEYCETLVYSPWHGLKEHRPLGGINRLRQKVYTASSGHRGCPASPEMPPQDVQALLSGGQPTVQPDRGGGPRGGPAPSRGLR